MTAAKSAGEPAGESAGQPDEVSDWERRRRLAEVFGDVLPDITTDERDPGTAPDADRAGDAWLREQVPPHHGS